MCQCRPSASVHSSAKMICRQRCTGWDISNLADCHQFTVFMLDLFKTMAICNKCYYYPRGILKSHKESECFSFSKYFSLVVIPHRRLSSVVWVAQHGAFHSESFHHGRSRSNPPAVHYMWSKQSMPGARKGQGSPSRQTLPFLHRWCFHHTVICRTWLIKTSCND